MTDKKNIAGYGIILFAAAAGIFFVVFRQSPKMSSESTEVVKNETKEFLSPTKDNVQQDFKQQLAHLKTAVEKDSANVTHIMMLARMLMDAHNVSEAIIYFERGLKLNPKDTSALLDIAVCYAEIKQYEKALNVTNALLRIKPWNTSALYNRGAILATIGKNKEAEIAWKLLIAKFPESAESEKARTGLRQLGLQ